MQIKEGFTKFTKERHTEDKGKNYNFLQDVYANTEFFDLSLYDFHGTNLHGFSRNPQGVYTGDFTVEDFDLPFRTVFIKLKEDVFLFMREHSPRIVTGTMYFTNYKTQEITGTLNCPFSIFLETQEIRDNLNAPLSRKDTDSLIVNVFKVTIQACQILSELSKKAVVTDTDTTQRKEYYRRKGEPTIKVPVRPIYYVLGDKKENVKHKYDKIQSIGKLEYTSAFKVRGHWRKLPSDLSVGKNRDGVRNVIGYTWVMEFTKGEGELVKRIRVIKP